MKSGVKIFLLLTATLVLMLAETSCEDAYESACGRYYEECEGKISLFSQGECADRLRSQAEVNGDFCGGEYAESQANYSECVAELSCEKLGEALRYMIFGEEPPEACQKELSLLHKSGCSKKE